MSEFSPIPRPGRTFFFTLSLAPAAGVTLTGRLGVFRAAYRRTWHEQPFVTEAIVVLPDHLHAVWTLPVEDTDFALRWGKIRSRFSRALLSQGGTTGLRAWGEHGIWQRRMQEVRIRDRHEMTHHIAYCWSDPVRHKFVVRASDWTPSSIHRAIRAGCVDADWTAQADLATRFAASPLWPQQHQHRAVYA